MSGTLIGYARCSTDEQDLTGQRDRLAEFGVKVDRIYLDHGLTGTKRARPGLDQALAAVRSGDTLVVPKLVCAQLGARTPALRRTLRGGTRTTPPEGSAG